MMYMLKSNNISFKFTNKYTQHYNLHEIHEIYFLKNIYALLITYY